MKVSNYLHTAILVTDLAKSDQFYGDILGLKQLERPFNYPGAWYEIGEAQIHLILVNEIPATPVNLEKWGRNRHLALKVDDLEAAKQVLLNHNYEFQMSASGRPALFTQDPDGNFIELSE